MHRKRNSWLGEMADEREFPEFQVRHPSNTNPICLTKLVTRYINPGYQNTHRTHSEIAEIGTNTKLTTGTKNKNDYTSNNFILEYGQLCCSVTIISYFSNFYLTHNVFNVLTLYFRVMLYVSLDSQGNFT